MRSSLTISFISVTVDLPRIKVISEYLYHNLTRDGERELAGMQERAQLTGRKIVVDFAPGRGYTVTVEVPV